MSNYYKTTTDKTDVEIPSWATEYDVGDTIRWEHDDVDGVQESEVVGFSTLFEVGYPVIEPPFDEIDGDSHIQCAAVTEETVIKLIDND